MTDGTDPTTLAEGSRAAMPPYALGRHIAFMRGEAPEAARDWMQVDVFKASVVDLTAGMTQLLHELTMGVFWPHRGHDLDLLLQLGQGWIALDQIGRPLSAAMHFGAGTDFAMCGMMVTTPRLQAQGTGRWLLRRVMVACAGRDLRLSATRDGYRLYESAGFVPVGLISQHQGRVRRIQPPAPVAGLTLRPAVAADLPRIAALDAHAYGAPRHEVLTAIAGLSQVVVAERAGVMTGFAMMRDFGRGHVIGPLVAEDEAEAIALAAGFIEAMPDRFLRLDTPQQDSALSAFLAAAGMGVFDTVTEMRLGRMRRALTGPVTWGLAAHSLG